MSITRRDFVAGAGLAALGTALPLRGAFAQGAPIKVGVLLDASGNIDIYGKPMAMASRMAVDEINEAGGLLGRKLQLIEYDTQSDIALYTKFAQQLVRDDKVHVVHGGITSASREAIRQTFRRANTLYFYNILYEGGVCDRNTVCTGTTPAQVIEPVVDLAMKRWGNKVYVLAADYNYGQIAAKWIAHYVKQRNGTTLKTDFFPLDVADFGSTIAKIQQEKPSFVVSALVGGAHMSFYRQWAASGMNTRIPLAATVFGVGNEQLALSAAEGDGILIAGNYSQEIDTPANKDFLARWQKRFGDPRSVHEIAVSQYQGIHLWAQAVRNAKAIEHAPVLAALEAGVSIEGPSGTVTIEPKTHHAALDVRVMEVKGQKNTILETVKQRPPSDTAQYCDLQKNPKENKQFEVSI
ncbi:MAG: transporter substrate-binding protein [Burkholderiaceae bacterium]|nr:transporter substrate-binding protein [Burkholderiaceae bacterium]